MTCVGGVSHARAEPGVSPGPDTWLGPPRCSSAGPPPRCTAPSGQASPGHGICARSFSAYHALGEVRMDRSVACLLSVFIAMTCGCAKPYPPGDSRVHEPRGFVHRFSSVPRIVVEDQPIASFRLSPEERQAMEKAREEFNKAREERVDRLTAQRMSGRNSVEGMTLDCVVQTFIIFSPLCIVIVPVAYGTGTVIEGRRASRHEPYMPALPSQQELLAVHEKILSHVTATGIAYRLGDSPSDREGSECGAISPSGHHSVICGLQRRANLRHQVSRSGTPLRAERAGRKPNISISSAITRTRSV